MIWIVIISLLLTLSGCSSFTTPSYPVDESNPTSSVIDNNAIGDDNSVQSSLPKEIIPQDPSIIEPSISNEIPVESSETVPIIEETIPSMEMQYQKGDTTPTCVFVN